MNDLGARLANMLGSEVTEITALSGGCVGDARRATLADGRRVVAKAGTPGSNALTVEANMLRYLMERTALPVPHVLFAADDLLVMDYIPSGDPLNDLVETDAAEKIAALHAISDTAFGFSFDTVIGGLHQPNPLTATWREFFRDQRLMFMGRAAMTAGRLPAPVFARVERLCANLDRWIGNTTKSSLIHGDLWSGNILIHGDRLVGVIDPALYFADAEIELAFTTLFDTFNESFFARYDELRPIALGFFEERRDLYNLYPLLVHVRLFGGSYVASVERTLKQFGF